MSVNKCEAYALVERAISERVRPADIPTWFEAQWPDVAGNLRVPAGPVREAMISSGLSQAEMARRAGYQDTRRLRDLLDPTRKVVNRATAERMMRALGKDPFEVGL